MQRQEQPVSSPGLDAQRSTGQHVISQLQAAPSPAAASTSTRTAERDTSWRSSLLHRFDAVHLSEIEDVALLHRTDTKYLLSEDQLCQTLDRLTDHYQILDIDGQRLHRYRTLYFDTQDLALYLQHHNGQRDRYKVRMRAYEDSKQVFLEVKRKTNSGQTIKSRTQTAEWSAQLPADAQSFLRTEYPYPAEELEARLLNTFQRITLVSTHGMERVTLDVGLLSLWNGAGASLAGIAIAEVKQVRFSMDSAFVRQMRALDVRPTSFSKYCIGVSMLYPGIKHNRFKPQLRQIAQLSHQSLASQGRTTCQTNNLD